jgi:threonine synthase
MSLFGVPSATLALPADLVLPFVVPGEPMNLRCIECGATYGPRETRTRCACGGLLEVALAIPALDRAIVDGRLGARDHPFYSGVWRFRELLPQLPDDCIVTKPEGNTNLYHDPRIDDFAGTEVWLKHEGENPTGSFKDRGMTAGVSHARWTGASIVACASTGNTSASVAAYAATANLPSIVFIPEGKITAAKLGQTIAYGARILQVRGDFDAAMRMVQDASSRYGLYLLNSLNPFRLEGQKTIFWETLQQRRWQAPDWVVIPGGNLGNTAALGKAIREGLAAGLLDRVPHVAVVQAEGAAPLFKAYQSGFAEYRPVEAETVASAIRIGDPVNYTKAVRTIRDTEGLVTTASDQEILDTKALVDRIGIGCEPASAAGLAGIRRLVAEGLIQPGERVLTYLTGHVLKDTDVIVSYHLEGGGGVRANRPLVIDATPESLDRALADVL